MLLLAFFIYIPLHKVKICALSAGLNVNEAFVLYRDRFNE